jgi:hypothetical protein
VVLAAGILLCALWQGVAPVMVTADSLVRGGSERDRGEPSVPRDFGAGLSDSRFSPAERLTRPFGSDPAANALRTAAAVNACLPPSEGWPVVHDGL